MPSGEVRWNLNRERAKEGKTSGQNRAGTTLEVNGIRIGSVRSSNVFFTHARTLEATLSREAAERLRCSFAAEGRDNFKRFSLPAPGICCSK